MALQIRICPNHPIARREGFAGYPVQVPRFAVGLKWAPIPGDALTAEIRLLAKSIGGNPPLVEIQGEPDQAKSGGGDTAAPGNPDGNEAKAAAGQAAGDPAGNGDTAPGGAPKGKPGPKPKAAKAAKG